MLKDKIIPFNGETKYVFFSGKGGVGKTTVSASTAVWLATQGYKTLIISTDLQMSLNDIFAQKLNSTPTGIVGVPNLFGISIDTGESLERNRKQVIDALKIVDPDSPLLKQIEMDKKSDCGCAQAAVFEFTKYLNSKKEFDVIVFDTAPIGTTLEKIGGQAKFVLNIVNQIDVKKKLIEEIGLTKLNEQIKALEDAVVSDLNAIYNLQSENTSFIMVMIPERLPLAEVQRNIPVLENEHHINVRGIVINNILPQQERISTPFWRKKWEMQDKYVNMTFDSYKNRSIAKVFLMESEVIGINKLHKIGNQLYGGE